MANSMIQKAHKESIHILTWSIISVALSLKPKHRLLKSLRHIGGADLMPMTNDLSVKDLSKGNNKLSDPLAR